MHSEDCLFKQVHVRKYAGMLHYCENICPLPIVFSLMGLLIRWRDCLCSVSEYTRFEPDRLQSGLECFAHGSLIDHRPTVKVQGRGYASRRSLAIVPYLH